MAPGHEEAIPSHSQFSTKPNIMIERGKFIYLYKLLCLKICTCHTNDFIMDIYSKELVYETQSTFCFY